MPWYLVLPPLQPLPDWTLWPTPVLAPPKYPNNHNNEIIGRKKFPHTLDSVWPCLEAFPGPHPTMAFQKDPVHPTACKVPTTSLPLPCHPHLPPSYSSNPPDIACPRAFALAMPSIWCALPPLRARFTFPGCTSSRKLSWNPPHQGQAPSCSQRAHLFPL